MQTLIAYWQTEYTEINDTISGTGSQKGMVIHMQVNGIIAEYNPFHKGHKYHLEESLRLTGADYTVIVMSGDFVQRGAPAIIDKHTRAEMALCCGADLVLELPVLYATASAEYFAAGAVSLLDKLGVVTHLCFGSESMKSGHPNTISLPEIAALILHESDAYRAALKEFLRQGASYPHARTKALIQSYPFLTNYKDIFSSPNNILGIEYCKAILQCQSQMIPVAITRLGSDYHNSQMTTQFSSALAIRHALYAGKSPQKLLHHLPAGAGAILIRYLEEHPLMRSDSFSAALYYKLLMEKESGYEQYLDVSEDLSNRIRNLLGQFTGFDAFCDLLKTKDMTYTRISRCLLHILLAIKKDDIKKQDMNSGQSMDIIPYARVLGFRKSAAPLLNAVKKHASIPLVTKLADAKKSLEADAYRLLSQDILSGELYQGIAAAQSGQAAINECSQPLIIL